MASFFTSVVDRWKGALPQMTTRGRHFNSFQGNDDSLLVCSVYITLCIEAITQKTISKLFFNTGSIYNTFRIFFKLKCQQARCFHIEGWWIFYEIKSISYSNYLFNVSEQHFLLQTWHFNDIQSQTFSIQSQTWFGDVRKVLKNTEYVDKARL